MAVRLDLSDLAAEQWGLVTAAQARSLGVTPQALARFARQGILERLVHGVYRAAGAPPSPLDDLRAAWLTLDPARCARDRRREARPAVVSFRSAAAVHGLGDLAADAMEFTVSGRKQTRRPDVRIHRGELDRGDWTVVDGLPVTTVLRTIRDLASARTDGGHLAGAVRDALTRQLVEDDQVAEALRPYAHRYGAALGDGDALVSRLLNEAGVPDVLGRVAARVRSGAIDPVSLDEQIAAAIARQLQAPAFQRLVQQLEEAARLSSPADDSAAAADQAHR
ncbi:MAG: type IV toxin-antitoxin system AbiEi family antitoxin domain-containing protein [Tomitella sp.]|nr:type IV toxin-antitoxin system AbiEi family antitoxin domain-containing protein [Tomitella sp.]